MFTSSNISCGVKQLYGLDRSPVDTVYDSIQPAVFDHRVYFCMVLFSDVVSGRKRKTGGTALAAYIEEQGLGDIIASDPMVNPNSRRKIQTWIWQVDSKALIEWLAKQKKERHA